MSAAQAERGELRKQIDDMKARAQAIECDAVAYFQRAPGVEGEVDLAARILRSLQILAGEAYRLDKQLPDARACRCCRIIKQSVTIGDFQSERRSPRRADDRLLTEIGEKVRSFEQHMEMAFLARVGKP